ncbi:MAG: uroporphyrinogen-III C-methyltransferase [Planctomycetota bacterium]
MTDPAQPPTTPDNSTPPTGFVSLVGAGPGDPGLLTVLGQQRLQHATAVVFDALANPVLMDLAPPDAERIDVGKRAKLHKVKQPDTNQLLVDLAKQGHRVVRLKGGDPYLYGRGAEEAAFCAKQGVPCEVVPGVTAGIAAPAYAGIPVTHRHLASTLTFVTGHEDPSKDQTAIDYPALAALIAVGGTACFYMGVTRLQAICDTLVAHDLPDTTPAAIVQWGTLPKQRHVVGTLNTLPDKTTAAGIKAPAIIVVGPVCAIDEPGLDFFFNPETKPLFGKRVLITRTRQQASTLRDALADLGAEVLEAPTIEVHPPESYDEVDQQLLALDQTDWLVLTSANAVSVLADRLDAMNLDARALAGTKLAAVGQSTADALHQRLAVRPDFIPNRPNAAALAEELADHADLLGLHMLLLRADIAADPIVDALSAAGARVSAVTAYHTRPVAELPEPVRQAFEDATLDAVTFTSSSTARNLHALLGDKAIDLLSPPLLLSIGLMTSQTLRDLGSPPDAEAEQPSPVALAQALADRFRTTPASP